MEKIVTQNSIIVSGISTRTNNYSEMKLEEGKINQLWNDFYQRFHYEIQSKNYSIYGVYHDYQSDMNGDFTVTAALENLTSIEKDINILHLPAGKYLKFTEKGEMPQAVIQCWEKVWAYFMSESCTYTRTYSFDYEYYLNNGVEIYIGIH